MGNKTPPIREDAHKKSIFAQKLEKKSVSGYYKTKNRTKKVAWTTKPLV